MAVPTIVALFDRPDQARQAVVALERRGVDANDITVDEGDLPVPVDQGTRAVDHQTSVEPVRRYFTGGAIGALVLATVAIVVVVVMAVDPLGLAITIAAIAGAIVGFLMGGFFTTAASQPVSSDAYDTHLGETAGVDGVRVEVHVQDDVADPEAVEATLRDLHPRELHRVA